MKLIRFLILISAFALIALWPCASHGQFTTNKPVMMANLFDRTTLSFINRAGVQNDRIAREAVERLVRELKAGGIWQRLVAFYPFVGSTTNSHACNLISTNYTITWYGTNTFTTNGVTGNGINSHGDTGYDMDNDPRVSSQGIHLYVYWSTNNLHTNATVRTLIGCKTQEGTAEFSLGIISNKTKFVYGQNAVSITNNAAPGNLYGQYFSSAGRFLMNRTNLTQGSAAASDGADRGNISVLCLGNVDTQFSTGTLRAASIGYKMPPAMVSNYFAIVARFQSTLNRNVQ